MRILISICLLLVTIETLVVEAPAKPPGDPKTVDEAKEQYQSRIKTLRSQYTNAAKPIFDEFVKHLERILKEKTMAGDLDGAIEVRDELQRVKAEGSDAIAAQDADPASEWRVGKRYADLIKTATVALTFDRRQGSWFQSDGNDSGLSGIMEGDLSEVEGVVGKGIKLDGRGSVGIFELHRRLASGLTSLSISVWIRPRECRGFVFDFGHATSRNVSVALGIWDDHKHGHFVMPPESGGQMTEFLAPLNQWSHVVAVWDGQAQYVFVDGKPAAQSRSPKTFRLNEQTIDYNPGRIGALSKSSNRRDTTWYVGDIDEFAIFPRALTRSEISVLHSLR